MSIQLSDFLEVMVDRSTGLLLTDCSGMCLTASELGVWVPGNPIAQAHPLCPEHGDPHAAAITERDRLRQTWAPGETRPAYDEHDTVAVLREVDSFYERFGDAA